MKTLMLFLVSAISLFASDALVTTGWVKQHLNVKNIVFVDVSDSTRYKLEGHIPGARSTDIKVWRKPEGKHLVVRSKVEVEKEMRGLGINNDSLVILYAHIATPKDLLKSTYIYWAMKYYGLQHVALMDGGFEKWVKEGHAVSHEEPKHTAGNFTATIDPTRMIALEGVKANIGKLRMLDARPGKYYFGVEPSPTVERAGHIEKAASYPWTFSINSDFTVRSKEALEKTIKEGLGLEPAKEMIVYCTGGLETSFNYFILEGVLGFDKVRLYDASMKEWGNRTDTSMTQFKWE